MSIMSTDIIFFTKATILLLLVVKYVILDEAYGFVRNSTLP